MHPAVFLTWIAHERTRTIAARLSIPLAELTSKQRGLRRYAELAPLTFRELRKRKPRVLIVQAPSQILALLALLLRPVFGYRLALDAHNEAVEPYLHPSRLMNALTNWLLRKADRVIISNRQLADIVSLRGGRAIILPDALPRPPPTDAKALRGPCSVVVISTYAGDEPFEAVIEAARGDHGEMHFYVTGNSAKCPARLRELVPKNMTLTGFLSEHDYWSLLASCDMVIDLTTMDHCLVCGAYEAVALGKPVLLSRNQASVELFSDFAEFTDNSAVDIAAGLARLRSRIQALKASGAAQRAAFDARWSASAAELTRFIDETAAKPQAHPAD